MPSRTARKTPVSKRILKERVKGALLGLAVGDALGLPALFLTPVEIRRRFGPRGIRDFVRGDYHPTGAVSDDTATALATARALIDAGDLGVDAFGLAVASQLVKWSRDADLDRAPDATLMRSINRLAEGIPWRGSGDPGSRSAGGLARAVPVGIAFALRPDSIPDMAQAACFPTHAHPVAVASFVSVALLFASAVSGQAPRTWSAQLNRRLGPLAAEVKVKLDMAFRRRRGRPSRVLPVIGEGWTADEVVARSLYAALHHPGDFTRAVLLCCNTSGDTAAVASLAGALIGAMEGSAAIPRAWRDGVEGAAGIRAMADGLTSIVQRGRG